MKSKDSSEYINADYYDLRVPSGTEQMTTFEAALAWAQNGFYVLPIQPSTKHPGSVVGSGWPSASSRDEEKIKAWFTSSNYGLAIHVGKSGAICFDVDKPKCLPSPLKERIFLKEVPYQSTREGDSQRGHYLFATEIGKSYSNSNGRLGKEWGEVRGENGIIVVAPSQHSKSSEGGRYLWQRCGLLPLLPRVIEDRLPQNTGEFVNQASFDEVSAFLEKYSESDFEYLLQQRIEEAFNKARVGSRHATTLTLLTDCLKEARAGLYSASEVISQVSRFFTLIKPEHEWSSKNELVGLIQYAVGRVQKTPQSEIDQIRYVAELVNHYNTQNNPKGRHA